MADFPLYDYQLSQLVSNRIRNVAILNQLGSGSYAQVYEIEADFNVNAEPDPVESAWKRLKFAMKCIHHRTEGLLPSEQDKDVYDFDLSCPSLFNRWIADVRALTHLRHENICNMVEHIAIPDLNQFPYAVTCVILELCDGNLYDLQKEFEEIRKDEQHSQKLGLKMVRHLMAQVLRGYTYCIRMDIQQNDVKMENILYQLSPNVQNSDTFEDRVLGMKFKLTNFDLHVERGDQSFESSMFYQLSRMARLMTCVSPFRKFPNNDYGPESPVVDFYRDLCNQIRPEVLLKHRFLQENNEPRTEPFIIRPRIEDKADIPDDLEPLKT